MGGDLMQVSCGGFPLPSPREYDPGANPRSSQPVSPTDLGDKSASPSLQLGALISISLPN